MLPPCKIDFFIKYLDDEEPIYESIKLKTQTLHPDEPIPGPSSYNGQMRAEETPPPVPPKSSEFEQMTRADRLVFLNGFILINIYSVFFTFAI